MKFMSLYNLHVLQDGNADRLPGIELLYIAVCYGTHVIGGSETGWKFLLESDSHVPISFVGYVAANSSMYFCVHLR